MPRLSPQFPILSLLASAISLGCSSPIVISQPSSVPQSRGWTSSLPTPPIVEQTQAPHADTRPAPAPNPAPTPNPDPAPQPIPVATTPYHWCITGDAEPSVVRNRTLYRDDTRIFYEHQFGKYPRFYQGRRSNGGIPQLADMPAHLDAITRTLTREIPDPNWSGYGVIDYESWEPLWSRISQEYKDASIALLNEQWPTLPEDRVEEIAKQRFEDAAKAFMLATIEHCKSLRPRARWGYYGYPRGHHNENLSWLWDASTALYPSFYLTKKGVEPGTPLTDSTAHRDSIEASWLNAVQRTSELSRQAPVLPFVWFKYHEFNKDFRGTLVSEDDARTMMTIPLQAGADGVILWGHTATPQQASQLTTYLRQTLDPIARDIIRQRGSSQP